jgi:hypothetical protein
MDCGEISIIRLRLGVMAFNGIRWVKDLEIPDKTDNLANSQASPRGIE